VTKDEGLCSPKAIAFIFNRSNPSSARLNTKTYSTVCISRQVATEFLEQQFFPEERLNVSLMKKLGDKKWIK
jgi:hypothetical protein